MAEFYETESALQRLTETNLKKEFKNVHDYCQSAIHFANRCDMNLSINHVVLAAMSGSHLVEAAQQRYINGAITSEEWIQIVDKTTELVGALLPVEVTKSITVSCDCRKA